MSQVQGDNEPHWDGLHTIPYTPITSIWKEIGLLCGFIVLSILMMVLYWYFWQISQRRSAAKEALRREEVAAQARIRAAAQREREKTYTRSAGGESSESNSLAAPGNAEWGQSSRRHQNGDSSYGLGYAVVAEDLIV